MVLIKKTDIRCQIIQRIVIKDWNGKTNDKKVIIKLNITNSRNKKIKEKNIRRVKIIRN